MKNIIPNAGGLAYEHTGKYESNRHALAKMEKVTFGEAAKYLRSKKGGGIPVSASFLLHAWISINGTPEWHHAGFLPKSYGGGMRKTYFLDHYLSAKECIKILKQYSRKNTNILRKCEEHLVRERKRQDFLKKYGKRFERVLKTPPFSVTTSTEMKGKYGWFNAIGRTYNLPEYYSGYAFKNEQIKIKYFQL